MVEIKDSREQRLKLEVVQVEFYRSFSQIVVRDNKDFFGKNVRRR